MKRETRKRSKNPPIPPLKKGGKGGFTLVEYILVVALSGIIFLALAQAVIITIRSWDIALSGARIIEQAEVSFSRMAREIRLIKNKTSLVTANVHAIRFTDINDNDIQYVLDGDQVKRNSKVDMDDVDSLTFEYLDKNGAVIASPIVSPNNTNVRMVRITVTISPGNQSLTVRTLVRIRNMT